MKILQLFLAIGATLLAHRAWAREVPPLDGEIPVEIKTATFGLG